MPRYVLSRRSDQDIDDITQTTIDKWGIGQAEIYVLGLHASFQLLASAPELGRDASNIRSGYRRFETASHVVFYRITSDGILIVRILHQRMDFRRHL